MYKLTSAALLLSLSAVTSAAERYGYGTEPSAALLEAIDIDVRPDGLGYPPGSGDVLSGEVVYTQQCAMCHGDFGEGTDRWPVLAGGEGTLKDERPEKTIGSYWPYASTIFDYVHRAMPFTAPQSLNDDQVYAVTAYLLYLNDLVDDDFVADKASLSAFTMPNEANFFVDDRPDVSNTRCMSDCKDPDSVQITWDSTELGVTPIDHLQDDGGSEGDDVTPPAPAAAADNAEGEAGYATACAMCHTSGIAGAPVIGDTAGWAERIAQGNAVLYQHAIEGFQGNSGFMPAKGGRADLTDDTIKAIVDYMVTQSQ